MSASRTPLRGWNAAASRIADLLRSVTSRRLSAMRAPRLAARCRERSEPPTILLPAGEGGDRRSPDEGARPLRAIPPEYALGRWRTGESDTHAAEEEEQREAEKSAIDREIVNPPI